MNIRGKHHTPLFGNFFYKVVDYKIQHIKQLI